jgi:aminopeptidase N
MKTPNSIVELLRKHHNEAASPMAFIRAIREKCGVHTSSVYRWLNGEKFPNGQHTLTLIDYLKQNQNRK